MGRIYILTIRPMHTLRRNVPEFSARYATSVAWAASRSAIRRAPLARWTPPGISFTRLKKGPPAEKRPSAVKLCSAREVASY